MNFRLQARRTNQVSTSTSEPTSGSELRQELYSQKLDGIEKAIVNTEVFDGKSLIDVMMAFKCKIPGNSFRVAIENDMPPRLYAESIIPLRGAYDDEILLPYLPISKFFATHPNFFSTNVSSARYIEYRGDERKEWQRGSFANEIFDKDIFEVYAQLLNGTLTNFFKDPTEENAKMVWRVSRTVESFSEIMLKKLLKSIRKELNDSKLPSHIANSLDEIIRKESKNAKEKGNESFPPPRITRLSPFSEVEIKVLQIYIQYKVEEKYSEVLEVIKNRDLSLEDARKYKRVTCELHPVIFYSILYLAMIVDQDVLHKSNFIQTDLLLSGLLLTKFLPEGVKLAGIEDAFLRILYERGSGLISPNLLLEIVEKEKLIAYLHENVGRAFHHYLKQNAFITETYRELLLFPSCNWYFTRFKKILFTIYSYIHTGSGITLFSHKISPSSSQYITDDVVAEFIASICTSKKSELKHTSLQTAMFNSTNENASALHRVLRRNIESLEAFMKESSSIAEEINKISTSRKTVDLLNGFRHPKAHIGSTELSRKFKKLLVAFIEKDSDNAPQALLALIEEATTSDVIILGRRRIISGIVYHSKPGGRIHTWAKSLYPIRFKNPGENLLAGMRNAKLSNDYTLDELSFKKEEYAEDKTSVPQFTFVPFESLQALASKNKYLHDLEVVLQSECPICMEENVTLYSLHGDIRHGVCYNCKKQITETCPFCRFYLKNWVY